MGRYHFNLYDGANILDDEGYEFRDFNEVRSQAIHFIGNALVDARQRVFNDRNWRLDVTDGSGAILLSVQIFAIETMDVERKSFAPDAALDDAAAAA